MNPSNSRAAGARYCRPVRPRATQAAAACVASALTLTSAIPALAAITASSELDICSASADPCVITQTVDVVSGSVLDFGVRAVEIRSGGLLNVGSGTVVFRAGSLLIDVNGTGIKLNEGLDGGVLLVETYKTCSGNPSVRCQVGIDCSLAGAGECTQGDGSITTRGRINGNCEFPGLCSLSAAGDIRVQDRIQLSGTTLESDGGEIELVSSASIFIEDKLELTAGGDSTGGDVLLDAALDVSINGIVDAGGGDFDGGTIEITAGRDILITEDLNADSNSGEGFGGSISVAAGGNIEVVGGGPSNPLLLTTEGHTGFDGAEAFAGDGGPQAYSAGGSLRFGEFVRLRANGAAPDGFADFISIEVVGPVVIEGEIQAKAKGGLGAGGDVEIDSDVSIELTAGSVIDVTGGDSGGGSLFVASKGDIEFGGEILSDASNGGSGGFVLFDADVEFRSDGSLTGSPNAGAEGSFVDIDGCRIQLGPAFELRNPGSGGRARFRVAEDFVLAAGASVENGADNRIEYRDPSIVPVISGSMIPTAGVQVNTALPSCPLCGNSVVDLGETCDDGNQVGGDGCSDQCQDEGCIAQTPGYPSVPLCDDGNDCSVDSCVPSAGGCQSVASCDDGFFCTIDTCVGDTCVHTPSDAACDDNNECTVEACNASLGCVFSTANVACDDGLFCNGTDSCVGGGCAIHDGDPCVGLGECVDACREEADTCIASFGHPCSSDANVCTDDVCNGLGTCIHILNSAPCDDGVFCNGPDFCLDGACRLSVGNPCSPSDPCADTCDESAALCTAPVNTPCADDSNVCTDDFCDGSGACVHAPNAAPCDDGDLCTLTDGCTAGSCIATDARPFSSIKFVAQKRGGADNDKLSFRATIPGATMTDGPADSGMLLEIRGAAGSLLYGSFVPAENFVDSGLKGTTFKFRDRNAEVASANGIASVTIKRNTKRDEVRAKLKLRGTDIPAVVDEKQLTAALLVGGSPDSGRCGSVTGLACTKKGTSKLSCTD